MDFREINEFLKDTFKYIAVIVVALLLVIFVVGFEQIVGPSMNNTLVEDDVVVLNKFIYNFREPKREEVIILKKNEKHMVKRVIGLPGDSIEIKDNILYINGKEYKEDYVSSDTKDFNLTELGYEKIPDGYYFVLGDNRGNSQDSRNYGLITKDEIIGKVMFRLYPFNKIKIIK